MYVSDARKVIIDNDLIPQKISKKIINYISGNKKNLEKETFTYVKKKRLSFIKKNFSD